MVTILGNAEARVRELETTARAVVEAEAEWRQPGDEHRERAAAWDQREAIDALASLLGVELPD
jgi:hypothetical protein